jgi:hypothetical protein
MSPITTDALSDLVEHADHGPTVSPVPVNAPRPSKREVEHLARGKHGIAGREEGSPDLDLYPAAAGVRRERSETQVRVSRASFGHVANSPMIRLIGAARTDHRPVRRSVLVFEPPEPRIVRRHLADRLSDLAQHSHHRPALALTPTVPTNPNKHVVEDLRCAPKAVANKASTDLDLQSTSAFGRRMRSKTQIRVCNPSLRL